MSIEAMSWARKQRGLTPTNKLLLMLLADHANASHLCYPAIDRLAEDMEVHSRTVKRGIKDLEEKGVIGVKRQGSGHKTNLYELFVEKGVILSPLPLEDDDMDVTPGVTPVSSTVTPVSNNSDTHVTQTVKNHQENRQKNPHREPPAGGLFELDHPPSFENFWKVYPRKIDKRAAEKAWNAALKRGATPDQIIKGAGEYARAVQSREKRYIKHPTSWLNAGSYDNEVEPTTVSGYAPYTNTNAGWDDEGSYALPGVQVQTWGQAQ